MVQTLSPEVLIERDICHKREVFLGRLALGECVKGVNRPMNHLVDLLRDGKEAMLAIEEDGPTIFAEGIPDPFVNYIQLDFTGGDFVSIKDKKSMYQMNKNNLDTVQAMLGQDSSIKDELERSKLELQEVEKLVEWFKTAEVGTYMIFESPPLGDQNAAASRIYQKLSDGRLEMCFVTLYNPRIEQFNLLRSELGADDDTVYETALDILKANYEFTLPFEATRSHEFTDYYVGYYDMIMDQKTGSKVQFGKECISGVEFVDGLERVRRYPQLTSIYSEALLAIANSDGRMSFELMNLMEKLHLDNNFVEGQSLSVEIIEKILDDVVVGITSSIARCKETVLNSLGDADVCLNTRYQIVALHGGQARSEGVTYSSPFCPTHNQSKADSNVSGYESNVLYDAFGFAIREKLPGFGQEKMGVCRINNCPNRGDPNKLPKRTVVGGCDVCVDCHIYFLKNKKSPEREYADKVQKQKAKAEKEMKRQKRDQKRVAEVIRLEDMKRRRKIVANMQEKSLQQNPVKYQQAA